MCVAVRQLAQLAQLAHHTLADLQEHERAGSRGLRWQVPAQGASAGDEVPSQWRGGGGGVTVVFQGNPELYLSYNTP